SPGRLIVPLGAFCQTNITWNTGLCARLRGGRTISTTCSNGMSSCSCAAKTCPLTRSSSSPTVAVPQTPSRSASVLTKNPISPSISTRLRLPTGGPTTTSSCPDNRASSAAQPASTVMYSVVLCFRLSPFSPAVNSSSSTSLAAAPL